MNGPRRFDRRHVTAGLAALGIAAPSIVRAQGMFSGKTIRIIIPFVPGGATDIIGRIMGDKLSQMWGATIIIENKAGAGANLGTDAAAKSAPDGLTWMVGSVGMATNPFLYSNLSYDPQKDLDPVTLLAMVPNILVVSKNIKFQSVSELIAFAKANPGKLTYGSSGIGTSIHLSGELFKKLTGTDIVHVPYRGSAASLQDLISGQLDLIFDNITSSIEHVRGGSIRAMGITTSTRSPHAPDLAPIIETVPGFDVSSWFAFFVPAKTPKDMILKIQQDSKLALADPVVKSRMDAIAAQIVASTPDELGAHLRAESDKWGKLIRDGNIKAQ